MRRFSLTCTLMAALAAPLLAGTPDVVINEVDADQTSTDSVEFFELFGAGGTSLTDCFVVLYNGSNDTEYKTFDLDGFSIPGDGYFVVGAATVANVDVTPSNFPATNAIQNGQDGIALFYDTTGALADTDFFGTIAGSPPAGATLIDALVYDTSDADDAVLLAALNITGPQVNENENSASTTESNGRCPDGGTAFDTASYSQGLPTPGGPNDCPVTNAWTDEGNALAGVNGDPVLTGSGDLSDGSSNDVDLTNAAAGATAGLFIGLGPVTPLGFKGGTLVPVPFLDPLILTTGGLGDIPVNFTMPPAIPTGVEIFVQYAIQDAAAIKGVALSNAIKGTTP